MPDSRGRFVRLFFLICLLWSSVASTALAAPSAAPPRCDAAEYRAFDFWLGAWTVRDAKGQVQGRNVITSEFRGCVVQEHWESITPVGVVDQTGSSFSAYDFRTKQWHHSWFDSFGNLLQLDGAPLPGGGIQMSGRRLTPAGTTAVERTSWVPLPDGRVHQLWDYSLDEGRTWTVRFEAFYTKEAAE